MRILIVEDEMDIRAILKEGLESHLACTVDTAADRAAVEMARRCHYDLVIADMHLSDDLDALTIIDEITEFDDKVRFIVMTGKIRLDVATKIVEALKGSQVSSFLFKPFDLEELYVAVDKVRAQVRAESAAP